MSTQLPTQETEKKPTTPSVSLGKFQAQLISDKLDILGRQPLLGSVMNTLVVQTIPFGTLAVGYDKIKGWSLFINEAFYCAHTVAQRQAFIVHEVWHALLTHCTRLPHDELANVACDIIVNELIDDMRNLYPDGCFYEKFGLTKSEGDSVESIYAQLKKKCPQVTIYMPSSKGGQGQPQDQKSQGKGQSKSGQKDKQGQGATILDDHSVWQGVSPEDNAKAGLDPATAEKAKAQLQQIVEQAIKQHSKEFGDLPASVQNQIKAGLKSKVSWRKHVRIFGQSVVRVSKSYTHKRPNRRMGEPFPGKKSNAGGKVLVGVDVSGSVPEGDKKQFLAELNYLTRMAQVEVMTFDAGPVQVFKSWRKGLTIGNTNGGTDPQCVFDHAKASKVRPGAVIILTDGCFGDVNTHGFKTLFVVTDPRCKRPEGKTVALDNS